MAISGKELKTYAELLDGVEKGVEFLSHKKEDALTGAYTGFKKIDEFTGGYQPGVDIISLEMSAHQLVTRTVAIDTNFHLNQLVKTRFDKDEYFITLSKHKHRMEGYPC
ncbi:hypothetical protein [Flavobacterium sp. '19STA2R22 D10 B1']|uniref:hypothetical protein n=1 Tax=Flavobacterium aerium TaxID=3037261 RepID=UPI00278C6BB8|nr:hypothetical protein [Flavobacterium sp. '19STA2R22 D10 B1']